MTYMIDHKKNLQAILNSVLMNSDNDFTGVGIIIYKNINSLPIFPLRENFPDINDNKIIESLIKISSSSSEYHDGFHLISDDWKLTHVSQFFSPPILSSASLDQSKLFGSRYVAALFGSSISEVILTGIASKGFGQAIFESGEEIYFKKDAS